MSAQIIPFPEPEPLANRYLAHLLRLQGHDEAFCREWGQKLGPTISDRPEDIELMQRAINGGGVA